MRDLRAAGLTWARFIPLTAAVVVPRREFVAETWLLETPEAQFGSASTPRLRVKRAPARGLLENVRLRMVGRPRTATPPAPLQAIRRAEPLAPATPAKAAGIALAPVLREAAPKRAEDPGTRSVAFAGIVLRPGAVALLRRASALPRPGYPLFAFTAHEAPDFDDDSTYAAAGPCEAQPPSAVPPRRRHRQPAQDRVPLACGWLNGHQHWPSGVAPAPLSNGAVVPRVRPVMPSREAALDEEDRERLAAAVGEGWETGRMWKSRLFR
jgi:hypothetical protein